MPTVGAMSFSAFSTSFRLKGRFLTQTRIFWFKSLCPALVAGNAVMPVGAPAKAEDVEAGRGE
jgi:hypothetical protein